MPVWVTVGQGEGGGLTSIRDPVHSEVHLCMKEGSRRWRLMHGYEDGVILVSVLVCT